MKTRDVAAYQMSHIRSAPKTGAMAMAMTAAAVALLCSPLFAEEPDVLEGYKTPTLTVPYAHAKPTIDGRIDDAEWRSALSVNALQTTRGTVASRQTRFWMMWDEDHLYLAMRSPLRPGERPIQNQRGPGRESAKVVFDDSYEVWLDVGANDPKTGLDCFVQFLANPAGKTYDTLHLPTVGNSRMGYDTNWTPINRLTDDGKAWEWEMVVPRESIFKGEPFAEGEVVQCLLARNFKRPWTQHSIGGVGSFKVTEMYSRYRLAKDAPAVHLLDVRDFEAKTYGMHVAAFGRSDEQLTWRFHAPDGTRKEGTLDLRAGGLATTGPMLDLVKPGKGAFRITVADAEGKTLLDWASTPKFDKDDPTKVINDRGDVVKANPTFNPVHDYVRVRGDFIQFDDRDAIENVTIEVFDGDGGVIAEADAKIDKHAYVEAVLPLDDPADGEYLTRVTWRDSDGEAMGSSEQAFVKKNHAEAFEWWNTERGNIEKVISPWTAVTWEGGTFGVWGRTMEAGDAGLPAQVTTKGRPLLAGATELVARAGDRTVRLSAAGQPEVAFDEDHRKIVNFEGRLGDIDVASEVKVEFDGMYKVTLTLDPRRPTRLDALQLKVPFDPEAAEYVHACGEGIRTGFHYGFLPSDERGRIWSCKSVDSQPMVKGSFIPYVWVGSTEGGLAWFADSDEGWAPHETTPAIEVRRDADERTDLVLNLVSERMTLDEPRTITFAFQASPVKKMHEKWRMDSWWCGDTFQNFALTNHLIWSAIPFPRDVEKSRKMVQRQHNSTNRMIFGIDKYRANAVPYFIHQALPSGLVPEVEYFGDQWQTSVSECLFYGETLTDYMVHNYSKWCEQTGIDGFYIDNMRPVADDNIEAGRGYKLPDGRVQPTYQMFSTRRYFLRMRAAFAEQGKHNKIVLHMTNNMILPWVGAADIAYDGEHFVIFPEMDQDFMDKWSMERLRVDYPAQWGIAVNFMQQYQGRWDRRREAKAFRAYTGMVGLHDALPSGNANGKNPPFWIGRDRFGIEQDDARFVGYWEEDRAVTHERDEVFVSYWKRPGKALVLVVNRNREAVDVPVTVNASALGLGDPADWKVQDAEAETQVRHRGKVVWDSAEEKPVRRRGGVLTIPVKARDYRQIIISKP